jgi:hypothetical protein
MKTGKVRTTTVYKTAPLQNNQSHCTPKRDTSQYNVHGIPHSIRIYAAQQQNNKLYSLDINVKHC